MPFKIFQHLFPCAPFFRKYQKMFSSRKLLISAHHRGVHCTATLIVREITFMFVTIFLMKVVWFSKTSHLIIVSIA